MATATSGVLSSPARYFKPNKSGEKLSRKCKEIVLNVFSRLSQENQKPSVDETVQRTSFLTGVSVSSIYAARNEFRVHGNVKSPAKARPASKGTRVRTNKYPEFILNGIRRKVHDFFRRNEIPTIKKVTAELNKENDSEFSE